MYTIIVEGSFSATHQLALADGSIEPLHGHDWGVRAHFASPTLDRCGMVLDFEDARAGLRSVLERLRYVDLNQHEGFRGANPTAEAVARYIFDRLREAGLTMLRRVEVTEAPGCVAVYEETD
jgi:6-pyruvoyltetrahydropterin/6-carboxytetrahydropterin synthase